MRPQTMSLRETELLSQCLSSLWPQSLAGLSCLSEFGLLQKTISTGVPVPMGQVRQAWPCKRDTPNVHVSYPQHSEPEGKRPQNEVAPNAMFKCGPWAPCLPSISRAALYNNAFLCQTPNTTRHCGLLQNAGQARLHENQEQQKLSNCERVHSHERAEL